MEHIPCPSLAVPGQPPGDQLVVGEAPRAQVPGQLLPGRGRVANAEPLGVGTLEPALGQEGAPCRGARALQLLGVELRRGPVCVNQPAAPALLLARNVPALLVPQVDAGPPGQPLDRLDERQAVDQLHELDDVAAFGAAKTVEEATRGGHVERGGLFVVERAQALQRLTARAAQLQVLADHLVDGRALTDRRNVLIADSACHRPASAL